MSKFLMQAATHRLALASARIDSAMRTASANCLAKARQLDMRSVASMALAAAVLVSAADPAFAQQTGGTGALTVFLQNLVNMLTGTAGKLIAVIAICIVGIGALMGALSLRAAGAVLLGVMLVFSSAWIVDQIIA
jgi:type IV secretory pathway VirB2 component (pilin)